MRPHRRAFQQLPPQGIKKFPWQKKADFIPDFEIKKVFSGEDIKEKATQMGTHSGAFK